MSNAEAKRIEENNTRILFFYHFPTQHSQKAENPNANQIISHAQSTEALPCLPEKHLIPHKLTG